MCNIRHPNEMKEKKNNNNNEKKVLLHQIETQFTHPYNNKKWKRKERKKWKQMKKNEMK